MQTQTTTVVVQRPPYDKTTAVAIGLGVAFLTGIHGGMRFYIGDVGIGVAQCITCGGCWIWSIIDWINYEAVVDEANRRAGWSGNQSTTTTVSYQQPQVVYQQQPGVVYQQQPGVVYQQQPQVVYQQQPGVVYQQQPGMYQQPQVQTVQVVQQPASNTVYL